MWEREDQGGAESVLVSVGGGSRIFLAFVRAYLEPEDLRSYYIVM